MKDRLKTIYQGYGVDAFRDGKKLLGYHADLFPREKQDRRWLKLLLMVDGNTRLLDALQKKPGVQSVIIARLARQLQSDWGLQNRITREMVTAFWLAVGGQEDALKGIAETGTSVPVPPSVPPRTAPAQSPAFGVIPADAVCRPSDYLSPFGILRNYTGKDTVIRLPDDISIIGEYAFVTKGLLGDWKSSRPVEEVYCPAGLKRVDMAAFYRCDKLRIVSFQDGLYGIGAQAFRKCTSLKTVIIPDSVHEIAKNAFAECSGITVVASDRWKKKNPHLLSLIQNPPK